MIEKASLLHSGCWEAGVTATGPASLKADIPASPDGWSAGFPQLETLSYLSAKALNSASPVLLRMV